jgi:predicted membrane-bound mannosyltransferase
LSNAAATVNLAALRRWWRGQTGPLVLLAGVKLAIHLATNGVYGFQRDELYYILSGQHPAFGYVDYPPVTPMLARLDTTLFGTSPWTLRILTAIVGVLLVLLTGLCAREMGGGRSIQALAAFVALVCPLLLGANWLFQTVTFDQLTWLIAMYLMLRLLKSYSPRLWLLLGLDIGIGFETNFTAADRCKERSVLPRWPATPASARALGRKWVAPGAHRTRVRPTIR